MSGKPGAKPNDWCSAEDAILREHYPAGGSRATEKALLAANVSPVYRTAKSIKIRAQKLHVGCVLRAKAGFWTPDRLAVLREHYPAKGAVWVADQLGCGPKTVEDKCSRLKVRRVRNAHAIERDEAIRKHYADLGTEAIAQMFGIPASSVRRRAAQLKVKADRSRPKPRRANQTPTTVVLRKSAKKPAALTKQEVDRTPAKSTGKCKPFVDRRWLPDGPVPRVVDSAECRPWAKAAA